MLETLEWYHENVDTLSYHVNQLLNRPGYELLPRISDILDNIVLSSVSLDDFGIEIDDIRAVFEQFSSEFWERSIMIGLGFHKSLWFSAGMVNNEDGTQPTLDQYLAFSPTSYIPGFTSYSGDSQPDSSVVFDATVHLYSLDSRMPKVVRRIVAVEALIHEIVHTVLTPLKERQKLKKNYLLEFNGKTQSEFDVYLSLTKIIGESEPISHYCTFYAREDEVFARAGEEICESVSAYMLEFAFRTKDSRFNLDPLGDRLELEQQLEIFLNGKVAK